MNPAGTAAPLLRIICSSRRVDESNACVSAPQGSSLVAHRGRDPPCRWYRCRESNPVLQVGSLTCRRSHLTCEKRNKGRRWTLRALSTELPPPVVQHLERRIGIEPMTSSLEGITQHLRSLGAPARSRTGLSRVQAGRVARYASGAWRRDGRVGGSRCQLAGAREREGKRRPPSRRRGATRTTLASEASGFPSSPLPGGRGGNRTHRPLAVATRVPGEYLAPVQDGPSSGR